MADFVNRSNKSFYANQPHRDHRYSHQRPWHSGQPCWCLWSIVSMLHATLAFPRQWRLWEKLPMRAGWSRRYDDHEFWPSAPGWACWVVLQICVWTYIVQTGAATAARRRLCLSRWPIRTSRSGVLFHGQSCASFLTASNSHSPPVGPISAA